MPNDAQSGISGVDIPTTDVYDVQLIQSLDVNSQEFKEFLVRLRQSTNNISLSVNYRDSGYYTEDLQTCGQVYFPNKALPATDEPLYRQVFRIVVDFGALPNAMSKAVAHNIPDIDLNVTFTRIFATASNPTNLTYIPIPGDSSAAGGGITQIVLDSTLVEITTDWNGSLFTRCVIVLEYIKG